MMRAGLAGLEGARARHRLRAFLLPHVFVCISALAMSVASPSSAGEPAPVLAAGTHAGVRSWALEVCATRAWLQHERARGAIFQSAGVPARPATGAFVDSPRWPLRVHLRTPSGAPFAGLDDEERARQVAAWLEEAWDAQVVEQGYDPPLEDAERGGGPQLDVYLVSLPETAALTIAEDDPFPEDGRHGRASFLLIDDRLPSDELKSTVYHEFAHVLQFAMDSSESLMFFEASAMMQEYLAWQNGSVEGQFWSVFIDEFQSSPGLPPFVDLLSLGGDAIQPFYEYGAVLFLLYLEAELGALDGRYVRQLWQRSVQADHVAANEPDWLDALSADVEIEAAILDFATWRARVAGRAGTLPPFPGAAELSGDVHLETWSLLPSALDGSARVLQDGTGWRSLGCIPLEVSAALSTALPFELQVSAPTPEPFGISWLAFAEGGGPMGISGWIMGEQQLKQTLPVAAGTTMLVSICDLRAADADDVPEPRSLVVRAGTSNLPPCAWVDVDSLAARSLDCGDPAGELPANDTLGRDQPVADAVDAGCGCQSGAGSQRRSSGWAWLSLVGFLLFALRGFRAWRRRRLYRADGRRRDRTGRA